jgi:hypothetical protein
VGEGEGGGNLKHRRRKIFSVEVFEKAKQGKARQGSVDIRQMDKWRRFGRKTVGNA